MSNVAMTNYEMNKQAYASESYKFDSDKINIDLDLAATNFYLGNCKYVGLLCRERNDYTVFKLSNNKENFQNELKEVLHSRGIVVDVVYDINSMSDSYQIWMREPCTQSIIDLKNVIDFKWTPQVWMFMLFDATDWVIEVDD